MDQHRQIGAGASPMWTMGAFRRRGIVGAMAALGAAALARFLPPAQTGLAAVSDARAPGGSAALIAHPDGSYRRVFSMASPEGWLEDFGEGALVDGRAKVTLDPDFAALVKTDDYHVFVTPHRDTTGLFIASRGATSFQVWEQQGGASTLTFSYRVVAKRRDIEGPRFEKVTLPALPALPESGAPPQEPPPSPAAPDPGMPPPTHVPPELPPGPDTARQISGP